MSRFLEEALEGLPGRLEDALDRIEGAIGEKEAELSALRRERSQVQRVLKTLTPDAVKKLPPKPTTRKERGLQVSEEKLQKLTDWLEENVGDEAFYSTGLAKQKNFTVMTGQSQLSKALRVLHDRGVIRLDGVTGSGGRKTYRLARKTSGS